jgi:hypothetical protein
VVEVLIEEMFGSDRSRSKDYKRAVVVALGKKKAKENEREKLFQVKRKKCVQKELKKSLTGPTLLEMSGWSCREAWAAPLTRVWNGGHVAAEGTAFRAERGRISCHYTSDF